MKGKNIMKSKMCFTLALIAGLCVPAAGDVEAPLTEEQPLLVWANPALAGIEQLYIVIMPLAAELNEYGLVWEELRSKVQQKLVKEGINTGAGSVPGGVGPMEVPNIRVEIDILELADLRQYVFRVQTSLARAVYMARQSGVLFKPDVWTMGATIQAVSAQGISAAVTGQVCEQVEAFIAAWLAANPQRVQVPDANNVGIASKERGKPAIKPATAEYKYVASKNSKVFHRPHCSWARRIKPENITGYNSRDEAIKAGRRPCKRCKP